MIYTIVERKTGKRYGLDAKDIDAVRRHIYWKEGEGMWDIYKGRRLLGTMSRGVSWWTYEPDTGYSRSYEVVGNGAIRDEDWEGY